MLTETSLLQLYFIMSKLNDKWFRIITIPVVALVANFVFYQPDNDIQHISWLKGLFISLIEWTILLEVNRQGIRVARRGFTVDQTFFAQVEAAKEYFDDVPSTRALYLDPDGSPRNVGAVIRNPDMARTYERMADRGVRRGFYRGPVAQAPHPRAILLTRSLTLTSSAPLDTATRRLEGRRS